MSLLLSGFIALVLAASVVSAADPPNIVFILADDMGYGDVEMYSVYPEKNSHYKLLTPNLVKMAEEGMMFTDGYAGAPGLSYYHFHFIAIICCVLCCALCLHSPS